MKRKKSGHRPLTKAVLALMLGGLGASATEPPPLTAGTLPAEPPIALPAETLPTAPPLAAELAPTPAQTRSGRDIYLRFRDGLADPNCNNTAGSRWRKHFGHAPKQLAQGSGDLLPLFGYVVDALDEAGLPTEFALIPFVESGYKPAAHSSSGPAGMWQFIGITARNQGIAMRNGYDGRLSPVESTQAAVRYLKTLYGMFGGDWRLAVMAYNAGEYRVLQSMRRAGMNARNARPAELPGLSPITYAYVDKLHALACLFEQADDRETWLRSLDRPVPQLTAIALPVDARSLDIWAKHEGHDPAMLRRLNPALAGGIVRGGKPLRVLAPTRDPAPMEPMEARLVAAYDEAAAAPGPSATEATPADNPSSGRSYTVARGDSLWTIARRNGISVQRLRELNQLDLRSVLTPGKVLRLE